MANGEEFRYLDSIICSDEVMVADGEGLIDGVPPFSNDALTTVYISRAHPWKEEDGDIAENCPRNPGFDSAVELGCFACTQSNISYGHGNAIFT